MLFCCDCQQQPPSSVISFCRWIQRPQDQLEIKSLWVAVTDTLKCEPGVYVKHFKLLLLLYILYDIVIFNSIFGFLSSTFTMSRFFCCLTLCNIHYFNCKSNFIYLNIIKLEVFCYLGELDGGFMVVTNNKTHQKRITILNFIKGQTETAELIIGTVTYS